MCGGVDEDVSKNDKGVKMLQNIPDWNFQLREAINEHLGFIEKHTTENSKYKFHGVLVCLDWIDVSVTSIQNALDELKNAKGIDVCVKINQFIFCIDILWECVMQLHRFFVDEKTIPMSAEKSIFSNRLYPVDDNDYFKEIRAIFGVHSVNLDPKKKAPENYKFVGIPSIDGITDQYELVALLYSNIYEEESKRLLVPIAELITFYLSRYEYLNTIRKAVESITERTRNEFIRKTIQRVDDPIAQIDILINEDKDRFWGMLYTEELEQYKHFFETKFSPSNEGKIEGFRNKVFDRIKTIADNMQTMSGNDDEKENNLLFPKYRPRYETFGYEFAQLYKRVFLGAFSYCFAEILIEPLKEYVCFNYTSEGELYWLVLIALDLAQSDLKIIDEQYKPTGLDILDMIDQMLKEPVDSSEREKLLDSLD